LSERGVLEATGPQRQKFLQGMLSHDVQGRGPGQGCLAAFLTVKGHVLVLLRALVEKDAVLLEMPADRLALVERTLNHYKVAAPVRFKTRPGLVLGLVGQKAEDALRAVGAEAPGAEAEAHLATTIGGHPVLVARASDLPGGGFVVHAAPEVAGGVREALGREALPVGQATLDALRVEALRPWYGYDVTEDNLLHETGLVAEYASFSKGCYIGQEVVARLDARGGNVNKALRGLRLRAPAERGALVVAEDKEVGIVTTSALSPRRGPIALAYVHRSHYADGALVRVGGEQATVVTSFPEVA
jgi:folate-binding protein YgfZ